MIASACDERALRDEVLATARAMNASGINRGRSGNVSVRCVTKDFDGFLITPSGVAYDALEAGAIVAMHGDGTARDPDALPPSSEWHFHRAIYRAKPAVAAIVHTHSVYATTLACAQRAIPAFHYMVAIAGGDDIPCAPYALFGTEALADTAVEALRDRRACLLAQHGVIAAGEDLASAFELAVQVETLAEMYWHLLQVGEPRLLTAAEMRDVRERFLSYGPQGATIVHESGTP